MPHPTNTCLGEEEALKEALKKESDAIFSYTIALLSGDSLAIFLAGKACDMTKAARETAEKALDECMKCLVE